MKPSKLIAFLKENDRILKKSLSQNFLVDDNIIKKIVRTAKVEPNDTILEIGPGAGSLTEALLETKATVVAVEKDSFFANSLSRLGGNLKVYNTDILTFDFSLIKQKTKIIANLPYNITTPILAKLLHFHVLFETITIMVQKEVGARICAGPGSKTYGSLSVFIQFYADTEYCFDVSKHCFLPKPNVDSAIIKLTLKTPPLKDPDSFFIIVRSAFQHRRKMLCKSLENLYTKNTVQETLNKLRINPQARPEDLGLEDWLELFKMLSANG